MLPLSVKWLLFLFLFFYYHYFRVCHVEDLFLINELRLLSFKRSFLVMDSFRVSGGKR